MKGTVLVTGATGFVGRAVVRHLASTGWRVVAAARGAYGIEATAEITALSLPDLGKPMHWAPLLAGITHAVHLAGIEHVTPETPEQLLMAVNGRAAGQLALAARSRGLKRVVVMSSVRAQSGPRSDVTLSETDDPRPTDAYGRSKLAGERAVSAALERCATDWVCLRPALVYGPGVKGNMRSLFVLAKSPWPMPVGGLKARRSLMSINNLCSAVAHALDAQSCSRHVYLVADEQPLTVANVIGALRAGLDRRPGVLPIPAVAGGALARLAGKADQWARLSGDLVVDTSRLIATGWRPHETSEAALAAAIKAEQSQRG